MKKKAIGSSFDDFLKEEGNFEEAHLVALKRVLTWQIEQAMKKMHIAKAEMARRMGTSRSQVNRLLDPDNGSVTLATLAKAGQVLGKEVRIELVAA